MQNGEPSHIKSPVMQFLKSTYSEELLRKLVITVKMFNLVLLVKVSSIPQYFLFRSRFKNGLTLRNLLHPYMSVISIPTLLNILFFGKIIMVLYI